jgi:flagellar hook-associated protein 3 FlgL
MERISTYFRFEHARASITGLQDRLGQLQAQVGSGRLAQDLRGYAGEAGQIISGRTILAGIEARIAQAKELDGRFAMQDEALGQARAAALRMSEALMSADGLDDGRGIAQTLDGVFAEVKGALNAQWAGGYVFGGERIDAAPILPASAAALSDLVAYPTTNDFFAASARSQNADLGEGAFPLAERAQTLAQGLFAAMRSLRQELDLSGGDFGKPLTAAQRTAITALQTQFRTAADGLGQAQARNGEQWKRVDEQLDRLEKRADYVTKELGGRVDADMAEVAMRLNQTTSQYQMSAQVFSQLRDMSLLNFLR